ncbi:MAG TPA: hypothetical protein VKQ71_08690 [Acidimicrobiales bacterium]|nr:hypothetical protein [Acidimicrobiales bacterium]
MLASQTAARSGAGHPFWHLLIVAIAAVAVFAGLKGWEWWRSYAQPEKSRPVSDTRPRRPWARPNSLLVIGVAPASAGCSATHAAVGPAHFHEATAFGVFFLVASALQAVWAVLVIRRADRLLLAIGAGANAAVLVLWAVTRTVGLPLGPETWRPEAVGAPDVFASLLELTVVVGASWLLVRQAHASRHPGRPSRPPAPALIAGMAP